MSEFQYWLVVAIAAWAALGVRALLQLRDRRLLNEPLYPERKKFGAAWRWNRRLLEEKAGTEVPLAWRVYTGCTLVVLGALAVVATVRCIVLLLSGD